jgi:hypothetical protein
VGLRNLNSKETIQRNIPKSSEDINKFLLKPTPEAELQMVIFSMKND